MQHFKNIRGVKGAASLCALAAIGYLLTRTLLQLGISTLMGLLVPGASLAMPTGFSQTAVECFDLLIGIGSMAAPLFWLLYATRLRPGDLRLTIPGQWSPAFCLPLFLGAANAANLLGGLLNQFLGDTGTVTTLPEGGFELFVSFLSLCFAPAICEELLFRGALQGLMRPCGSAAAILGPAILFSVLHGSLSQMVTALVCGICLGWMTERTGSLLPGMILHFTNNCIAFLNIYLQLYAPADTAFAFELFVLLFFPLCALWLLYRAHKQGFRFSAGLRPGVGALSVFTSPAYDVAVVFLLFLNLTL